MEIFCSVCENPFVLPLSALDNLIISDTTFCSPACFSTYVSRRVIALKSFGPVSARQQEKVHLSDASEAEYAVWSATLQMSFRSDFEGVVALYLYKKQHKFWYEKVSIKIGKKIYTPDFYLPEAACFVEVKGVWGAGSKAKYKKAMGSLYYHESLVLLPIWMKSKFSKEVR